MLGIVWPPTPELRKANLSWGWRETEGFEIVGVQVLGRDAVAGHHPDIAVLEGEIGQRLRGGRQRRRNQGDRQEEVPIDVPHHSPSDFDQGAGCDCPAPTCLLRPPELATAARQR